MIRDGEIFFEGLINSLKRHKDDAKEVKDGLECGIGVEGIKKFIDGDVIEVYEIKEVKRKLELNWHQLNHTAIRESWKTNSWNHKFDRN